MHGRHGDFLRQPTPLQCIEVTSLTPAPPQVTSEASQTYKNPGTFGSTEAKTIN